MKIIGIIFKWIGGITVLLIFFGLSFKYLDNSLFLFMKTKNVKLFDDLMNKDTFLGYDNKLKEIVDYMEINKIINMYLSGTDYFLDDGLLVTGEIINNLSGFKQVKLNDNGDDNGDDNVYEYCFYGDFNHRGGYPDICYELKTNKWKKFWWGPNEEGIGGEYGQLESEYIN